MPEPDIQKLIDQSAGTDIGALLQAKEMAKRRMMEDPTGANVSGYERASLLLEKAQEKKRAATGPADPGQAAETARFRRLSDVVKWLKDEGYKIKKSKVYLDAKAGHLPAADDGGFSMEAVLAYVYTQSLEKTSGGKDDKLAQLTEKRLEMEVEQLTKKVEKLTWDMERDQGKYLLKDDVRTELALKISAFEAGFKHLAVTRASDWIAAVGGLQEKQPALVEMVNSAIDTLLAEFAEVEELDLVVAAESCRKIIGQKEGNPCSSGKNLTNWRRNISMERLHTTRFTQSQWRPGCFRGRRSSRSRIGISSCRRPGPPRRGRLSTILLTIWIIAVLMAPEIDCALLVHDPEPFVVVEFGKIYVMDLGSEYPYTDYRPGIGPVR